jgi:mRNA-degrading endonuclease toxin of MazEF toxin-antitoxin module
MRRGDIVEIDLNPPIGGIGHEQSGRRPLTVISLGDDDPENPMITVIPFTKKINKSKYPHTLVVDPSQENGLTAKSVLMAFQIVSYDKTRVIGVIGYLEPNYMRQLEQILRSLMRL